MIMEWTTLEQKRLEFNEKLNAAFVGKTVADALFITDRVVVPDEIIFKFVDGTQVRISTCSMCTTSVTKFVGKQMTYIKVFFDGAICLQFYGGHQLLFPPDRENLCLNGFSPHTFECVDRQWSMGTEDDVRRIA